MSYCGSQGPGPGPAAAPASRLCPSTPCCSLAWGAWPSPQEKQGNSGGRAGPSARTADGFWTQTAVAAQQGFYLFYFSLNICCQTSYRSKLLHSTTSHLLFRIGRIRQVEVKSKHRRAGRSTKMHSWTDGIRYRVHNLIIKNIYMYISIM